MAPVGTILAGASVLKIMQIEYRSVKELKQYKNNPRHNDAAVEAVAASIEEFGFKNPIIIDKNDVIVAGHTRLKAAKLLHMEDVPTICADDLSDEQINAFRLADNKVAELATWDVAALDQELDRILDIDMEQFGFEFPEDDEEPREFGDERLRTDDAYNLYWNDIGATDGWFQMPIIEAEDIIPTDLTGFNYVLSNREAEGGVHFYLDDYQFERIWNSPEAYIDKLREYECVLSPNFSLYLDMPMAMKIWNTYRSRLVGQILQRNGVHVIPTICWAEAETFEFAFDGVRENAVVSISTIGCKNDPEATEIWRMGCDAMIEKLKPKAILLYGGRIEYDFRDIEVYEYDNHVTDQMKEKHNGR